MSALAPIMFCIVWSYIKNVSALTAMTYKSEVSLPESMRVQLLTMQFSEKKTVHVPQCVVLKLHSHNPKSITLNQIK